MDKRVLALALALGVLVMMSRKALEAYWWRTDTGLPNEPDEAARRNLERLRDFVDEHFPGARVTSAFRSHGVNSAVGGANNSYHLRGLAVDIDPREGLEAANAKAQVLKAQGLLAEAIPYWTDGHLHIALRG